MSDFFFDSWVSVTRTLIVGSLAYLFLVIVLRISGKRTLSKMNMFDFTVTVALGSTLATVILSKDVALAQGMIGLALLVLLQFLITFFTVRSKTFQSLVKASPTLLCYDGQFLEKALVSERVTKEEISAALRRKGVFHLSDVHAIVLETDGTFSIISDSHATKNELAELGIVVD